jgi:aminocarboxymuconate-semialdehyde decarboxylase
MKQIKAIDTHAHILSEETMRMISKEAPKVAPKLTPIDNDFAVLEVAGTPYRPFPRGGWDMERRLKDMDFAEVDVQVLSNTPQTFLYNQDAGLNATLSALQNDQIAKAVAADPGRFRGLATLPMQTPQKAADELKRAMQSLGLRGAHIGSNVNGKNLDDPELEVLWAAASELDAFIMVHPTQVAGADRLQSYYLTNLIGNPLDSTIAAASLVFSGVVERYPAIKFLFVHGGGFVPWQMGRFSHGWHVRPEPKVKLQQTPEASLNRLYFDSILHARPQLECLIKLAGTARVALGSDYPFDMGTLECTRQVKALSIADVDKDAVLHGTPLTLLGEAATSGERAKVAHG